MIPTLQWFHSVCHSYGWSIILLTMAVRILVWPLVAKSTRSMQAMQLLQPKLNALKEEYKDRPEEFQRKTMEFYRENKANPLGGCLPTLVQLPVLFALYATFVGPPFQDKAITVKVSLAKPGSDVKVVSNPSSSNNSAYVAEDGKTAKFVIQPGDQTLVFGRDDSGKETAGPKTIDFHLNAVAGDAPNNFKAPWKIQSDTMGAVITPETGQASFPQAGDVVVECALPGNAKPIDVPIKVKPSEGDGGGFLSGWFGNKDPYVSKTEQSEAQSTVMVDGQPVNVVVTPGPSTVVAGRGNVEFHLKAVSGMLPADLQPVWKIVKDDNAATIDENGHAVFPKPSEVTVAAIIPGTAKHESFLFVSSLGKVAKGADIFKPANWDILGMILAFGATMYISQMFMVQPSASSDPEQAAIQKQTQQTMPIAMTAMFMFIPLPAGFYIYMVFSNIVQTLQTWLIWRNPPKAADSESGSDDGGKKKLAAEPSGNGSQSGGDSVKLNTGKKAKANKKK
jgi:YidC/Oxa1 family membrane protein insertase